MKLPHERRGAAVVLWCFVGALLFLVGFTAGRSAPGWFVGVIGPAAAVIVFGVLGFFSVAAMRDKGEEPRDE